MTQTTPDLVRPSLSTQAGVGSERIRRLGCATKTLVGSALGGPVAPGAYSTGSVWALAALVQVAVRTV